MTRGRGRGEVARDQWSKRKKRSREKTPLEGGGSEGRLKGGGSKMGSYSSDPERKKKRGGLRARGDDS